MSSRFGWEGQYCTEVGQRPADEKMAFELVLCTYVLPVGPGQPYVSPHYNFIAMFPCFNHPFALTIVHIRKWFFVALQLLSIIVTVNRR